MDEVDVEFSNPPLTEVVIDVQFRGLTRELTPYFGLHWNSFRSEYPNVEVHPAVDLSLERLDAPQDDQVPSLRVMHKPETPRCWFVNEVGDRLVQLQQDRLVCNWRRVDGGGRYPRFDFVRETFRIEWARLVEFAKAQDLGQLEPVQVEVTYLNHIVPSAFPLVVEDGQVFANWAMPRGVGVPEDVSFAVRALMIDDAGVPIGRERIRVNSGRRRPDGAKVLIFSLAAKGAPLSPTFSGVEAFVELGHDRLVERFLQFTTVEAQRVWGRNI